MKSIASIMSIMTASLLLWACGNNTPKRIVSEVPIKTEVLGLKLGDVSSEDDVETALTKARRTVSLRWLEPFPHRLKSPMAGSLGTMSM